MTRAIAILASLLVVSCSPQVVDGYCLNYKPIIFSASGDTSDTVRQIRENNAVFDRLCK